MLFEGTITSIHQMTPDVKQFVVEADRDFEHESGQHTTARFDRDAVDELDELDELDDLERDVYVCGVPQMVVDAKARLADLGVDDDRVHTEGWEDGVVDE